MTNTYLNNDLTALNAAICHYGVPDQKWGKHNPNRRWQRHAVYAKGRPDPKAKNGDDKTGSKSSTSVGRSALKKASKERQKADLIQEEISKLQKRADELKKSEKSYREQYEREAANGTAKQRQKNLRLEQKLRYKESKRKTAADTYQSMKHIFRQSHEERMRDARSKVPLEVQYFRENIRNIKDRLKKTIIKTEVGVSRAIAFRSAQAIDKAFSKQMFNTTLSEREYKNIYDRTKEIFRNVYGDDIAEIMRPKLADKG